MFSGVSGGLNPRINGGKARQIGSNFFNVDMLMSNSADPSNNGSSGAQGFYAIIGTT